MIKRRHQSHATPATAFNAWFELILRSQEVLWASAEVIARRSYKLGGTVSDSRVKRSEATRMVTEKMAASADSVMAVSSGMLDLWRGMLFRPVSTTGGHDVSRAFIGLTTAAVELATAGLMPFHRRSRANAKRLRR